jgi:uncharacterized iron-regulated membrane protein
MKIIARLAGAAMVTASSAAIVLATSTDDVEAQAPAVSPAPMCINVRNIQRTEVQDDRTILFHMRNGQIWQNRLRQICPMLKISPWTQVLHSGDLVCSNQQFIHVIQTGNTCALGDFAPVSDANR